MNEFRCSEGNNAARLAENALRRLLPQKFRVSCLERLWCNHRIGNLQSWSLAWAMQSQGREVKCKSACDVASWSIRFLQKTLPYNSLYVIASLRCDRNNIPHWQHQSPSAQRSYISKYIGKSDESQVSPTVGDYLESPCCSFAPFCSHFSPPLSSARTKWWLLTYLLTYNTYF